jgi:hypothetical protein
MRLSLFTFLTRVCTCFFHIIWTIPEFEFTELLDYPEPDSGVVNPSEKIAQLVPKSSASPPTRGQPHQPSSSSSDAHAAHGDSPVQQATPEELFNPTSQQITREQNPGLNGLPSQPTGASRRPGRVLEEDDDGEGSTEHHAKLMAADAPSGKETARLEDGRLIELERQLSETLAVQTERDRRIAQLTDQLAQKSALLERAEVNVVEAKKRAGLEQRELQEKLDKSQLPHNQAEANAVEAMKRARLEQRELQAKLGELLLSRDQAEANTKEEKKRAGLELRELQTKLDESLLSRDHALEQAQSALQKATSRAADADERSQPAGEHETELAEVRAELEGKKSELEALRLRLTDAEDGWAKSKAEADTLRAGTQAAAGLVNMDVDRDMRRLMERVRSVEAEMSSLRGNEKSIESMECRNEG